MRRAGDGVRDAGAIVALALYTVAAYWPVGTFDFVNYDDPAYVSSNQLVQAGVTLTGIKWAFTTEAVGNWHPLAWLSHMVDCAVFGTNPGAHHWMNVAFHVANAIVLFLLLRQMLGSFWIGFFVAGLFALHPAHVESVAWVAERKDVLSTLFGLLTIWAYVNAVRRNTGFLWAIVPVLYALSLLSKPMLVTLPFVLLLLDYWPLKRFAIGDLSATRGVAPAWNVMAMVRNPRLISLISEKRPLFILAVVSCAVTFMAQHQGGAMKLLENLPLHERIANAIVAYVRYLEKTFWPTDLAVVYPHPGHWPMGIVIGAAGLLILITATAIKLARSHPFLIVGWLWFIGTLVPVIGIVQVGPQAMADRYTYVPLIGVFLAVVCGASCVLAALGKWRAPIGCALGIAVISACFVLTRAQVKVWADTETLYTHALQVTDRNWLVHSNLGAYLEGKGRLAEALVQFDQAAAINSDHPALQFYRANELFKLGKIGEAIEGLQRTLDLQPDHVEALNLLAWIRATSPDDFRRNGIEAVRLAERSLALNENKEARHLDTRAAAYAEAGRFGDAVKSAEEARKLALASNQTELAQVIATHVQEFRAGRALRIPG